MNTFVKLQQFSQQAIRQCKGQNGMGAAGPTSREDTLLLGVPKHNTVNVGISFLFKCLIMVLFIRNIILLSPEYIC